ncbi:MAG TPA: hypothetical protein VJB12_02185 [Candidatus Nanoarchaeia archaeon]|nr:hypothetical protein [Candidatus Nanoarchaeia archaeon]
MPDIEKTYKDLAKRHSLPDYSKLNAEFEISLIESEAFLLREIGRIITERIEYCTQIIDNIMHPEGSQLALLHECRFFDDVEKKELFETYKNLMMHHRSAIVASLSREEKEEAAFIMDFFNDWKAIKPKILLMARKMQSSWKTDAARDEIMGYFG